jgi:Flp pilus assembly secretin CpaC
VSSDISGETIDRAGSRRFDAFPHWRTRKLNGHGRIWRNVALGAVCVTALLAGRALPAQTTDTTVVRVDLPAGRSYPITTLSNITQVSVASPDVADVVVMGSREVVINGHGTGESDVILWMADAPLRHYRVSVHSPADRQQIVLAVKFAEVRRDFLRTLGISGLYRGSHARVGTGAFNTDNGFNATTGVFTLPSTGFGTVLTDFGTSTLLGLLEADESNGTARILAEPTLMAGNKDSASFLAGGEIPIPVAQNSSTGVPTITILWREFGIKLNFVGEIVSDSIIRLHLRPEVSSLDFSNALEIAGFKVPALRSRHIESTVDVRRDQSLIISGMMDDERQKTKDGIPFLKDIPILGTLFSSTNWQRNETELLIVITPVVTDPMHPRPQDVMHFSPDSALPARQALEPRLPGQPQPKP